MNNDTILAAITAALREETDNESLLIDMSSTAADVPGWDSLAHVRIMFNLEIRLGISIEITDTYAAETVGDLVAIMKKIL